MKILKPSNTNLALLMAKQPGLLKKLQQQDRLRNLTGLCETSFEKSAAKLWVQINPSLLENCNDPEKKKFLFRCFYVPVLASNQISGFSSEKKDPPMWLFEYAAHVHAFERMYVESLLRIKLKSDVPHEKLVSGCKDRREKRKRNPTAEIGLEAFHSALSTTNPHTTDFDEDYNDDSPEECSEGDISATQIRLEDLEDVIVADIEQSGKGYVFWLSRFDAWRNAASSSFLFYMGKKSKDITHPNDKQANAALLGTIESMSGWPSEIHSDIIKMVRQAGPEYLQVYYRNATDPKPKSKRWDYRVLDTWLIEIWPLVLEYHWTFDAILRVANSSSSFEFPPSNKVAFIEERCKKVLKLRLSSQAGQKKGRPILSDASGDIAVPPMCDAALSIFGIGSGVNPWMRGRILHRLFPSRSSPPTRGQTF